MPSGPLSRLPTPSGPAQDALGGHLYLLGPAGALVGGGLQTEALRSAAGVLTPPPRTPSALSPREGAEPWSTPSPEPHPWAFPRPVGRPTQSRSPIFPGAGRFCPPSSASVGRGRSGAWAAHAETQRLFNRRSPLSRQPRAPPTGGVVGKRRVETRQAWTLSHLSFLF